MYVLHTYYVPVNCDDTKMNKTNECPRLGGTYVRGRGERDSQIKEQDNFRQ